MKNEENYKKSIIFNSISDILESQDLSAVTFSSVASKCYMHKTAVAYYFNGKNDMLTQYFKHMQLRQDIDIPHPYPGCDPVQVFKEFIDNRIQMAAQDLPWIKAKYQFLLTTNPSDPFMHQFTINIASTQFSQIKPFLDMGIIEEKRLEKSLGLWFALACGLRFQMLFGTYQDYQKFSKTEGKELLLKRFLKEEYY